MVENIQTKMSEKYPCQFSSTALMCVMGAIQAVVFTLCMERDWSQWRLGWNIRLLTVSYTVLFFVVFFLIYFYFLDFKY
jgi:hypothetical protein